MKDYSPWGPKELDMTGQQTALIRLNFITIPLLVLSPQKKPMNFLVITLVLCSIAESDMIGQLTHVRAHTHSAQDKF